MSSHREAPEISKDPVADSTDLYAWVDSSSTVTILANYIPLEAPAGGPNFYEFGDDVVYDINIDHTGTGYPSIIYRFRFTTTVADPDTFLYNIGPITSLNSPNWNRRQSYTVSRVDKWGNEEVLGRGVCPPCNIGTRSTPNYAALADAAVTTLTSGEKVFCGQRSDAFWVDLGSVFDLAALRPFQNLHLIPMPAAPGVNSLAASNVHTIAIQVPIGRLTATGSQVMDATSPNAVIGIWTSASRQKVRMESDDGRSMGVGPWHQVSRLGNPLFNEVIVPMSKKDLWNRVAPHYDANFAQYVSKPELAGLLPVLYPGVFAKLAAYNKPRADLLAILLTGIPSGVVKGFQNYTGATQADMLRLNTAIPMSASPNSLGLLGGDLAGFPNGRRPGDNVVAIELRAIAGATIPLVDKSYTADAAASLVTDGSALTAKLLGTFPYLGLPYDGLDVPQPVPGS